MFVATRQKISKVTVQQFKKVIRQKIGRPYKHTWLCMHLKIINRSFVHLEFSIINLLWLLLLIIKWLIFFRFRFPQMFIVYNIIIWELSCKLTHHNHPLNLYSLIMILAFHGHMNFIRVIVNYEIELFLEAIIILLESF